MAETTSSNGTLTVHRPKTNRQRHARTAVGASISTLITLLAYGAFLRHGVAPAVVGYNLVPSERVLTGQIPYRDFIYNYTPGVLWLNAVIFRLLGVSLMSARIGVYLAKAASGLLLYLIGRRYLGQWLALLPVIMMLAWIGYGDLLKVFPTQYGMPLLLGAWLCSLKAAESESDRASTIWLIASGVCAGIVLVFKQNVGVFTIAAAVVSAIITYGQVNKSTHFVAAAIKRGALAAAGAAIPVSGMFVYLAAHSAFRPMLSHFLHHAVAYEEAKGIALPSPSVLLASLVIATTVGVIAVVLSRKATGLAAAWLGLSFIGLLGFVIFAGRFETGRLGALYQSLIADVYYLPIYVVACIAIVASVRKNFASGYLGQLVIGGLFALAAFLEIFPRSDADHLARVLPPSFVLVCALLSWRKVSRAFGPDDAGPEPGSPPRQSYQLRGIAMAGICLLTVALGVRVTWSPQFDGVFQFHDRSPLTFERGSGVMDTPSEASQLNAVVAFIQNSTSPNDAILAVSRKTTGLYFFAARPDTTKLLWFDSPGIPPADREEIFDRVSAKEFKLVVFGTDLSEMNGPEKNEISRYQKRLLALLEQYYDRSAVIEGITCFAPKK